MCKLLDLTADIGQQVSREPSARMVMANWAVQQAGKDEEINLALKWDFIRRLDEWVFSQDVTRGFVI